MTNRKGTLIVLSGPSGTGKGTVLKHFFDNYADDAVKLSISATTRLPRDGETDGVNYFIVEKEKFENMVQNDMLLEWASFCGNCYGTPKAFVDENLENGCDVILEIEVQGALKVMEKRPDAAFVFIAPPSMQELKKRIVGRQTETADVIEKRMETAKWEVQNISKYTYAVVNDDADMAAKRLKTIIDAERLKVEKNNFANLNG